MTRHSLDARRLLCPLPVIRTQNKVKQLAPGDLLEVICTDPGAQSDIPAWCRIHGHEITEINTGNGELRITIRVGNG